MSLVLIANIDFIYCSVSSSIQVKGQSDYKSAMWRNKNERDKRRIGKKTNEKEMDDHSLLWRFMANLWVTLSLYPSSDGGGGIVILVSYNYNFIRVNKNLVQHPSNKISIHLYNVSGIIILKRVKEVVLQKVIKILKLRTS